jgi:hypothetical protein
MSQTIESLVAASDLPLSVIIVGVGNADFTKMEILGIKNKFLKKMFLSIYNKIKILYAFYKKINIFLNHKIWINLFFN